MLFFLLKMLLFFIKTTYIQMLIKKQCLIFLNRFFVVVFVVKISDLYFDVLHVQTFRIRMSFYCQACLRILGICFSVISFQFTDKMRIKNTHHTTKYSGVHHIFVKISKNAGNLFSKTLAGKELIEKEYISKFTELFYFFNYVIVLI